MMHPYYLALGALLVLVWSCTPTEPVFQARFTESTELPFPIDSQQQFTFGYLEVLEDRERPQGRTIQLPVYYFKSRRTPAEPDPIIYTVGGPGASTMPSAPYMAYYPYLDDRDFILLEQRGTQYARPHLDCPEWAAAAAKIRQEQPTPAEREALQLAAAAACKKRLLARDIDLDAYHTAATAADIADLRRALGFDQYNLLTLSYSTKIAQVMMRDYPEGIRSVVMDSPLPLAVSYDEESVINLLAGLDTLLADCEAEPACRAAFPDLGPRFRQFLVETTRRPHALSVPNAAAGTRERVAVRGRDIMAFFADASTAEVARLPLEMEKLLGGDWSSIEAYLADRWRPAGLGNGQGMRLSVWCQEEFPFVDTAVVSAETQAHPEVLVWSPAVFEAPICQLWTSSRAQPRENQAVYSDIPTLLISGEYDVETPPRWAAQMQRELSHSFHVILPKWRHGPTTNWGDPCARQLAQQFFRQPQVPPTSDCLVELEQRPFVVED
ncbi:MAG: alpha/beta fold hydrolase [Bacteroidota bacterium]